MENEKGNLGSILVVGGCGFLGHRIVQYVLENHLSDDVHVLDIRTDRNRLVNVNYFDGDITSEQSVRDVLNQTKCQVIFHTASPLALVHDLNFFTKVNVEGTRTLLKCAQATTTVVAIVYTSSASVIHDSISDLVDVDESSPVLYMPDQREAYSHTKALAESLVLAANGKNGRMLTTSIRPSGLFGEEDPTTVKPMVEAASSGKYRYQVGSGDNLFDWTYIGNAAYAHVLAAQALLRAHNTTTKIPAEENAAGEAFIITNDQSVPFWDFARGIGAAAGYPTKREDVRTIPRMLGLVMAAIAEWWVWASSLGRRSSGMSRKGIKYSTMTRTFRIDKAKRVLKYKALVSMDEAVSRAGKSFHKNSKKAS